MAEIYTPPKFRQVSSISIDIYKPVNRELLEYIRDHEYQPLRIDLLSYDRAGQEIGDTTQHNIQGTNIIATQNGFDVPEMLRFTFQNPIAISNQNDYSLVVELSDRNGGNQSVRVNARIQEFIA
jgi:hypothetical protein